MLELSQNISTNSSDAFHSIGNNSNEMQTNAYQRCPKLVPDKATDMIGNIISIEIVKVSNIDLKEHLKKSRTRLHNARPYVKFWVGPEKLYTTIYNQVRKYAVTDWSAEWLGMTNPSVVHNMNPTFNRKCWFSYPAKQTGNSDERSIHAVVMDHKRNQKDAQLFGIGKLSIDTLLRDMGERKMGDTAEYEATYALTKKEYDDVDWPKWDETKGWVAVTRRTKKQNKKQERAGKKDKAREDCKDRKKVMKKVVKAQMEEGILDAKEADRMIKEWEQARDEYCKKKPQYGAGGIVGRGLTWMGKGTLRLGKSLGKMRKNVGNTVGKGFNAVTSPFTSYSSDASSTHKAQKVPYPGWSKDPTMTLRFKVVYEDPIR